MQSILKKLKDSTAVLNQRLFIIMTAQAKGWDWAKELEFLETGIINRNLSNVIVVNSFKIL